MQQPSTDGKSIVFVRAGRLYVLDTATNAAREVPVEMPSDRWELAERTINPRDYIQSMGVGNDGKTAVFEARGDIYLVTGEEGRAPAEPDVHARHARAVPAALARRQARRVLLGQDRRLPDLRDERLAATRTWEPVTTTLDRTAYHLEWSPDGTKILFGNKDFSLFYVDLATKKLTKFATSNQMKNDEFFWEVSDYAWSPDSKWVAYSFVEYNRNNRIYLYSLEQNKVVPVTDGFYDSMNPSFDVSGGYLYFLSYRDFTTQIDIFEDNHVIPHPVQVMAVQLEAGQAPPFEKRSAADTGDKKAEPRPFRIDLDGLSVARVPAAGEAGHLRVPEGRQGRRHVGRRRVLRRERDRGGLQALGRGQVGASASST